MKKKITRESKNAFTTIAWRVTMLILLANFVSCANHRTEVGLLDSQQRIPMPSFFARDNAESGRLPKYAQIRVYDVTDACRVPHCPIVWDVVVSEMHAPDEFVYGGFPGFGSQTVIPAQPLVPQRRYRLVTLPDQHASPGGSGSFNFKVSEDGTVLPD